MLITGKCVTHEAHTEADLKPRAAMNRAQIVVLIGLACISASSCQPPTVLAGPARQVHEEPPRGERGCLDTHAADGRYTVTRGECSVTIVPENKDGRGGAELLFEHSGQVPRKYRLPVCPRDAVLVAGNELVGYAYTQGPTGEGYMSCVAIDAHGQMHTLWDRMRQFRRFPATFAPSAFSLDYSDSDSRIYIGIRVADPKGTGEIPMVLAIDTAKRECAEWTVPSVAEHCRLTPVDVVSLENVSCIPGVPGVLCKWRTYPRLADQLRAGKGPTLQSGQFFAVVTEKSRPRFCIERAAGQLIWMDSLTDSSRLLVANEDVVVSVGDGKVVELKYRTADLKAQTIRFVINGAGETVSLLKE